MNMKCHADINWKYPDISEYERLKRWPYPRELNNDLLLLIHFEVKANVPRFFFRVLISSTHGVKAD